MTRTDRLKQTVAASLAVATASLLLAAILLRWLFTVALFSNSDSAATFHYRGHAPPAIDLGCSLPGASAPRDVTFHLAFAYPLVSFEGQIAIEYGEQNRTIWRGPFRSTITIHVTRARPAGMRPRTGPQAGIASPPGLFEDVLEHRATRAAAAEGPRRAHGLDLPVGRVELLEGPAGASRPG